MIQFLQPILLFSAAAVIVPVVIHLWNTKQGRTLKIGSIALLTGASKQRSRSLKLTEWLLLLLRCLLVILAAGLIAGPLVNQLIGNNKAKGWILLPRHELHFVYGKGKREIDSLLAAGFKFRYFDTAFSKDDFAEALKKNQDTLSDVSYWKLLDMLDLQIPDTMPVFLYTGQLNRNFYGNRPAVDLNLHWKTFNTGDSISHWPAAAFLVSGDSVAVSEGTSGATGVSYTTLKLSLASPSVGPYRIAAENGKLTVVDSTGTKEIVIDTATVQIAVATDSFTTDVKYVMAALSAVRKFTSRRMNIIFYRLPGEPDQNKRLDWLFWLSNREVPGFLKAKNIVRYQPGKIDRVNSWISGSTPGFDEPVALFKTVAPATGSGEEKLWQDGFGRAVLGRSLINGSNTYRFYSRFNPRWTDLVWRGELPLWLMQLLFGDQEDPFLSTLDLSRIDTAQIQPAFKQKTFNRTNVDVTRRYPLSGLVWILLFAVFALERYISLKKKRRVVNG